MNIVIAITFYLVFSRWTWSLVVTKYDQSTIGNYFYQVQSYIGHASLSLQEEEHNLLKYCHILRQSKIFNITNDTDTAVESVRVSKEYKISKGDLEMEKNYVKIHLRRHRIEDAKLPQHLLSFNCLDIEGNMKWLVSAGFVPHSAFLFIIYPEFHRHVFIRQIKNDEIFPKLTALIDEPAQLIFGNAFNVLVESIKASKSIVRDPLCNLHPILKYRLCVIVADARRRYRANEFAITSEYHLYKDQSFNSYYQPKDSEESCQPLRLDPSVRSPFISSRIRKMLFCSVKIPDYATTFHSFYLSLNTLNRSQVIYIMRYRNPFDSWSYNYHSLEVPLLRHLDDYENALRNSHI